MHRMLTFPLQCLQTGTEKGWCESAPRTTNGVGKSGLKRRPNPRENGAERRLTFHPKSFPIESERAPKTIVRESVWRDVAWQRRHWWSRDSLGGIIGVASTFISVSVAIASDNSV